MFNFQKGDKVKEIGKEQIWKVVGYKYKHVPIPFSLLGNPKRTKKEYSDNVLCEYTNEDETKVQATFRQHRLELVEE